MKIERIVLFLSYFIALIGVLSVAKYVNPIFLFVFFSVLIIAYILDKKKYYPIPTITLNIIGIILLIVLFPKSIDDVVVPLAEILIVLLSIKLIEPKKFRDFMQIYILSIFLLSASALLSIDFLFIVYFLILFFIIVISTILLTFLAEDENLVLDKELIKEFLSKLTLIPLMAIFPTIILFIFLPRTETPFFSFLNNQGEAKSGFSDMVELGDVSEIQQNNNPVMRVKMKQINRDALYWRGMTLTLFTGNYWLRRYIFNEKVKFPTNFGKIKQTIILEPYGEKYLFALDKPYLVNSRNIWVYADLTFELKNKFFKRIKYEAISVPSPFIYAENIDKRIYLQVPRNIPSKIKELAKKLKGNTIEETVNNIYKYFMLNYRYSLENLPKGGNSLENFLFKYKYGNCEYFASAAAILLRINGIPSRIVVGYRGGTYNELGEYYLITQSDAHSWVEYYHNGKWIRFDPTPPIESSPERQELKPSKWKILLDTLEYYWVNFIINYNVEKQKELFDKISGKLTGLPKELPNIKINKYLIISLLVAILIVITLAKFAKEFLLISEEKRYLNRFLKKLKKHGIEKDETEGLEELLDKIKDKELYLKAKKFVKIYEKIVYSNRKLTEEDKKELDKILGEI
jgi:transglutaminase-like putative cysteine protease